MAAGDRNKDGKPKDYVVHMIINQMPVCGIKKWMVGTDGSKDQGKPTCLNCIKILAVKTVFVRYKDQDGEIHTMTFISSDAVEINRFAAYYRRKIGNNKYLSVEIK